MDMRDMINAVSALFESVEGQNGPPEVRLVKTGRTALADKARLIAWVEKMTRDDF